MIEPNKNNENDPIEKTSVNCKLRSSVMKKFRAIGGIRGHKTLIEAIHESILEYVENHIDELKK